MKWTAAVMFAIAALVGGCYPHDPVPSCTNIMGCDNPADPTPTPIGPTPPGPEPVGTPSCASSCEHVEDPAPLGLGCQTDNTCFDICQRVKPARSAAFRSCLKGAKSCAAVSACDK